jgi:hypothetical protein
MPWTTQQHISTSNTGTGTTLAQAFASSPTVNNILVVCGVCYDSGGTVTITIADTIGNTWNTFANFPFRSATAGITGYIWWCQNNSTAADTVTITLHNTTAGRELYIAEFVPPAGTVASDGTSGGAQGTSGTIATPTITTSDSDDLLLNYVSSANAQTVHTPWTQLETQQGDTFNIILDVAAGTTAPNATQTSGTFASLVAALGTTGGSSAASHFPQFSAIPFMP